MRWGDTPHEICKGAIDARGPFRPGGRADGTRERIRSASEAAPAGCMGTTWGRPRPEIIEMDDKPSPRKRSPACVAMEMVRSGEAQGCVSAGNTGAIVAGVLRRGVWLARPAGPGRPCRPSSAVPSCWTSGPTCAVTGEPLPVRPDGHAAPGRSRVCRTRGGTSSNGTEGRSRATESVAGARARPREPQSRGTLLEGDIAWGTW